MKYKVIFSQDAQQDLDNIFEGIAYNLSEPETAARIKRKLIKAARSLDEMPYRFRVYDDEPWLSRGARVFPVGKYLIFYSVNEEENIVDIINIICGSRDLTLGGVDARLNIGFLR